MALPIHQKTRLRWVFLLTVPVLTAVAIFFFADRAKEENNLVRHTLLVQLSLERLLSGLDSAETSQRGYALTGEERFLEPYRAAVARVRNEFQQLRAFTSDNPRQQNAIARIEPLLQTKLDHMEENVRLQQAGQLDSTNLERRTDRGTALTDSILAVAGEMLAEENRLLQQRELDFSSTANRFTWAIAFVYMVLLGMVASLYHSVQRYSRQATDAEQRLSRLNAQLEQRVAERTSSLRASEDLLKIFVKHVPAAVAMLDRDMRYLQVSDRWSSDYSVSSDHMLGRSHYEIFPDLPERWKAIHARCLAGENLRAEEDYWDRADGSRTWLHWEIRPWGDKNGIPEGILLFSEDITQRKQMQEALRTSEQSLRELAGSLLTAQEDERRRIARDLHDDVTQRLAFVSIEIGKLAAAEISPADATGRLRSLQEQVIQVSHEVRRLSHGLHPSAIEDFGLSTALEEFCEEFSKVHEIHARFAGLIDDTGLSIEAASCLYRVAQESVRNASKHAGATQIHIALNKNGNQIQLRVTDNGAGFRAEPERISNGLGIVSMKERIRLVNGSLSITSQPGTGTEVLATVPISGARHETATCSTG